jgi:uncharacterized hydrophobic protein (TIGR00271 family)
MRLLQISVPEERRDVIVEELRERQLGYTVVEGAGDKEDEFVVQFLVPADAVEHVLDDLEELGYEEDWFTASIEAEFGSFEQIDDVQNKWAKTPNKIAPQALRSKAKDMRPNTKSYLWMMVLSAIVATSGLVVGSPAVVVGSMVIAPIVSPMLTASIGAVRDDREMLLDSVHQQGIGLAVAAVAAVGFAALLKVTVAVPTAISVGTMELTASRLSPGLLSITVGLVGGAAGAYGLATKGNVTIVGVMIAAALIPTAASAGIGFAWGNLVAGLGALVLLVIVIAAVNLGSYLMLLYLGYRPDKVDEGLLAPVSGREALVIGGTVLLAVAVLVPVGIGAYQQSTFELSINTATSDVLDDREYRGLTVAGTSTEYAGLGSGGNPTNVTITLSRTADGNFSELPSLLDRRITEATGEDVVVRVQFVDYETSEPQPTGNQSLATNRRVAAVRPHVAPSVG